jgi:hypothetical protein
MHVPTWAVAIVVTACALASLGASWLLNENFNSRVLVLDRAFHSNTQQGAPELAGVSPVVRLVWRAQQFYCASASLLLNDD